jgi:putative membrane protein
MLPSTVKNSTSASSPDSIAPAVSGATTSLQPEEQSRRTMMLNVERTWLAWWRTGLVSAAAAVGLGRVAPEVLDGHDWPYVVIGTGYAALAVVFLVLGGIRQRSLTRQLREGRFADLSGRWVSAITVAGAGLAVITMLLILTEV